MVKGLVVIEAPGKTETLTALLRGLGYGWRVIATRGHFMRNPDSLWPLAVTPGFEEPRRRADSKTRLDLTQSAAGRAVFIATDDDAEGDVIARDVAEAVSETAAQLTRIRIHSLTHQGVRSALDAHEPLDARAARQGDARRVLDRLIGHTFSRSGAPAGRVLTPLLASLQRQSPIVGVARLVVLCKNGGPPWRVEVPFTAAESSLWRARIAELNAHPGVSQASAEILPSQPAWTYNDLARAACGRPVPVQLRPDSVQAGGGVCA